MSCMIFPIRDVFAIIGFVAVVLVSIALYDQWKEKRKSKKIDKGR